MCRTSRCADCVTLTHSKPNTHTCRTTCTLARTNEEKVLCDQQTDCLRVKTPRSGLSEENVSDIISLVVLDKVPVTLLYT